MSKNVYIENFLQEMANRKYSCKTLQTYKVSLKKFFEFLSESGNIALQEVTPEFLEKYRLSLVRSKFTGQSLNTYIGTLRKFFGYLEDDGIIFCNPAERLRTPKIKRGILDVPSIEEIERLIDSVNVKTPTGIRDRAIIEIAYCCALRLNEMLQLTTKSYNIRNRTLVVLGKGRKERALPLGKQALKWLKIYISEVRPDLAGETDTDALWLTLQGKPMIGITYQKMLHSYAVNAGLAGKVTGHTMRRACATHMLRNGAHPVAVQHLLGHADLSTLGQYLDLSIDDLRKMHEKSNPGR